MAIEMASTDPRPEEPPVHDEIIIATLLEVMKGSESYQLITSCWEAICHIRKVVGRPC